MKCQLKSFENHEGKVKKTEKFEDKAKKPKKNLKAKRKSLELKAKNELNFTNGALCDIIFKLSVLYVNEGFLQVRKVNGTGKDDKFNE